MLTPDIGEEVEMNILNQKHNETNDTILLPVESLSVSCTVTSVQ